MYTETISAISTPFGRGGIAVIRISGDRALEVGDRVFRPFDKKPLSAHSARLAVYGELIHRGEVIDDGIATIFRSPASYTGEDTVEISFHGGIKLAETVLEATFAAGAVPAEAGEYTKRAFLSGKLTLSQAESVINLIDAETEEQIKLASSHRRGALSAAADSIYNDIMGLVSSSYAYIDYPDEDLTDVEIGDYKARLAKILAELDRLEKSYDTGRAVSEGIKTVIVGKPNAGKSSLLNAMLGEERAIVTDIAGTTRDVIEETVRLERIVLRLSDTAGIRDTDDVIEKIGVDLAKEKISGAELVFAVFDATTPLDKEDRELVSYIKKSAENKKVVAVINKTDSDVCAETVAELENEFEHSVKISAKSGAGVDSLFSLAESFYINGEIDYNSSAVIANARQHSAVLRAKEAVSNALTALENGFTQDIAGMDLEMALSSISELDSRSVGEDVVKQIFGRFCVGK